ncbi:hypothetical protein FH972_004828 [Carpinus fangiana]|uniref:non-specific serine/threonine protein kinase n=1 Tax=Carpinus fangiana TaxID=176857 RepID=A0A5N6QN36_9ROSI|nr:hypothetical protein FH972_004828 [Carpinus fangiana]
MLNGSLESHLFKGKSLLTWATRYNISQGLALALLYLHEEWEQCMLHRDIKSSNIMLDSSFSAKLGDFGLARMVEHAKGSQTTALAGTVSYMAIECIVSDRVSKESDIYIFEIVAMEITFGRKAIETKAKEDEINLLQWVWELYGTEKLLDAADPRLCGDFNERQMKRLMIVGLWCGHPYYSLRPSLRKVINVLDFEASLPIDRSRTKDACTNLCCPFRHDIYIFIFGYYIFYSVTIKLYYNLVASQLTMAFHPEKLLLLHHHLPHLMMMLTIIFLFLIIPSASQLSFNYPDFSQTNNGAITMAGNATISGSLIQLTPNAVDNWGRATYSETMHLWEKSTGKVASFTTSFSFIISSEGADRYSDGIIFFLSSPNFPTPIPTDGSGIGLVSRDQMRDSSFLAANKFVAVEFDTFRNDEPRWDPPEPVREHVGININDMKSRNTTAWYSVIKEKRKYNSTISYDSSTQNLSVSFTGFSSNDPIPIEQHLSSIVDLRDYLPERVEFGFSAGTGLISELHILCSWAFQSTAPLLIIQK